MTSESPHMSPPPYYTPTPIGYPPLGFPPLPSSFITSHPLAPGSPYWSPTSYMPTPLPQSPNNSDDADYIIKALGSPSWLIDLIKSNPETRSRDDLLKVLYKERDRQESQVLMSRRERRRWEASKRHASSSGTGADKPLEKVEKQKQLESRLREANAKLMSRMEQLIMSRNSLHESTNSPSNKCCTNDVCPLGSEADSSETNHLFYAKIDELAARKRRAFYQRRATTLEEKRVRAETPSLLEEALAKIHAESKAQLVKEELPEASARDNAVQKIERVYEMAKGYLASVKFEIPNLSRIYEDAMHGGIQHERHHDDTDTEDEAYIKDTKSKDHEQCKGNKDKPGLECTQVRLTQSKNRRSHQSRVDLTTVKDSNSSGQTGGAASSTPDVAYRERNPHHKRHHHRGGSDARVSNDYGIRDVRKELDELFAEKPRGRRLQRTPPTQRETIPRVKMPQHRTGSLERRHEQHTRKHGYPYQVTVSASMSKESNDQGDEIDTQQYATSNTQELCNKKLQEKPCNNISTNNQRRDNEYQSKDNTHQSGSTKCESQERGRQSGRAKYRSKGTEDQREVTGCQSDVEQGQRRGHRGRMVQQLVEAKERRERAGSMKPMQDSKGLSSEELMSARQFKPDSEESEVNPGVQGKEIVRDQEVAYRHDGIRFHEASFRRRKGAGHKEHSHLKGMSALLRRRTSSNHVPTLRAMGASNDSEITPLELEDPTTRRQRDDAEPDPSILRNTTRDISQSRHQLATETTEDLTGIRKRKEETQIHGQGHHKRGKRMADDETEEERDQTSYTTIMANLKADLSHITEIIEEGSEEDLYAWLRYVWDELARVEDVNTEREKLSAVQS